MLLANIVPTQHLRTLVGPDPIHLILSKQFEDPAYVGFYSECRSQGAYVILDNDAYEAESSADAEKVLTDALKVRASQIVVPDVLGNFNASMDVSVSALKFYAGNLSRLNSSGISLMLVPQGETIYWWGQALTALYETYFSLFGHRAFTIGIPKICAAWPGGRRSLLQRFVLPLRSTARFDVHLLGVSEELPDLKAIATAYPWVRSVDTCKATVYAMADVELRRGWYRAPQYPGRPEGFFQATLSEDTISKALHNARTYRYMCRPLGETS